MKIFKKVPAVFLVCASVFTLVFSFATFANVIYKDITSISIKTMINFDYENLQDGGVPEIDICDQYEDGSSSSGDDSCLIYTSSSKYYIESAEWYDSDANEFTIGGQPRVVVYLATKDYPSSGSSDRDYYYRFMSSYSASSCFISNGTFVSGQRESYELVKIVFKIKPLKGTFDQPENAFWADDRGTAEWYAPASNDSGYYDLVLYRDSSVAARVSRFHGTSYNFYSYMVKPGNYTFKVRTVGGTEAQAAYGKSSEYVESNSLDISKDNVYDPTIGASNYTQDGTSLLPGTGGVTNPANIGWIKQNNKWYFVRPDGKMVKGGWIEWKGKWYYLGDDGAMVTGWLEKNGREYFLQSDGAMLTGWLNSGNTYFYFNNEAGQENGTLCKNRFVNYNGKYFYFDNNGIMATGWRQIKDENGNTGFYYFYQKGEVDGLYGYAATNTYINGFYLGADGKWVQ